MSSADFLRIAEHKIFKETCAALPKTVKKPLNLLTVQDSVLFTWDFANNCVLSLNIKAARSKEGDNVVHQKLLPLQSPLFSPEFLFINESGSYLAIAGPEGVLVLQLPLKCPPYGAFDHNKNVVHCRSYSLDERLLAFSDNVQVRQAKFHPGSVNDCHVLVLTSDNNLRLYQIGQDEAVNIGVYAVGETPEGLFPGSYATFLEVYGEVAVDFDFGYPEIVHHKTVYKVASPQLQSKQALRSASRYDANNGSMSIQPKTPAITEKKKIEELAWPVYVLRGDFSVYTININLNGRNPAVLKGPCPISVAPEPTEGEACSIVCLKTTPQIVSIANSIGTLTHAVSLNIDPDDKAKIVEKLNVKKRSSVPDKELMVFETVELELGLTVPQEENGDDRSKAEATRYKCPVLLYRDESMVSRYYAIHNTGVHTVVVTAAEALHDYVSRSDAASPDSVFYGNESSAEYLISTRMSTSTKSNPVIGFGLYYEPTSLIALLSDGNVITMGLLTAPLATKDDSILVDHAKVESGDYQSPIKKMIKEPFDEYIQAILKKGGSRPLLKLSSTTNNTPEECYELLQRSSRMFREEYIKNMTRAREEIEKRVHTLKLLKETQMKEIEYMTNDKEKLREKAENLAEKYEDIKDKQDLLLTRCEKLLMQVSATKAQPSEAEQKFLHDLDMFSKKCERYKTSIDKLKRKSKYQELKIENWKASEENKEKRLTEMQANTIRKTVQESNEKIAEITQQINEYKALLGLN